MTSLASEPPSSRLLENGARAGGTPALRYAERVHPPSAVSPTRLDRPRLTQQPCGASLVAVLLATVALLGACAADEPRLAVVAPGAPDASNATAATASAPVGQPAASGVAAASASVRPAAAAEPAPPPRQWGRADLDPGNDFEVGPPDLVPDCEGRLRTAGVAFRPAPAIRLRTNARGEVVCGNEQLVTYVRGPGGIAFTPSPTVSCGLALALARLEQIAQEEAERQLGSRVKHISQSGTYNCRRMARFKLVSEHSYANAIDLRAFVLEDGRRLTVKRHFGGTDPDTDRPEARFLRTLARRLFDEDVLSVVLTPFFDRLHHDHFHLDQARYRTDGTRP